MISFQFSTFVSLMQHLLGYMETKTVVISFQFSTFVSLMQLTVDEDEAPLGCD